ncbi:enoyl-CoA hydratase/isomerase family protein [Amycolatopsis keratiniphila]|uniref:enoyl-CoA hydratase/isomerase family protein n=1 Tax=Amycolatopsis keratiniphila TaxID=129921 RepID=UPI00087BBA77|nr:enoyl-CoA hydratase/isomerase family protein [Amycolatopsis keratiniphila]OLZ49794.1 3-hydroxyisobutyryl-CoA hydrolase [Amycolatopsis keratiniphila subsp. nogabecina]SDU24252.1 enoyl-CoA hydratase [Amycolatopsis keratiniphila]
MNDAQFLVQSGIGRITLNRPRALNSLNHGMVLAMLDHLEAWRADPGVRAVLIDGAGDRGLCAGGDIRAIYEDARAGGTASLRFWADEYRLNLLISRYPKPYLALMDGLVMGGGVGVSAHGSHRIVTERSRVGMPETGIGFVPDVGGTYLLSRTPGELGTHIALTAGAISGPDAIHCGLADHFVPSERIPDLLDALTSRPTDEALELIAEPAPPSALAGDAAWIDHCYAADTVEEILSRLHAGGDAAATAAKEIEAKSPTALKVTLRALRSAAALPDLETVLAQEYRIAAHALSTAEFAEGIRAQIIDKDRAPKWSPATLSEVDDKIVNAYFS